MAIAPDTRALTTRDAAAAPPGAPRSSLIPGSSRNAYWLYLVPGLALLAVIIVIPLVWNVYLTFTDYRGIRPPEWIGLDNWIELAGDSVFWTSFGNSIAMIVAMVVVPTLLGLVLAAMLFDLIGKKFGGTARELPARHLLPAADPARGDRGDRDRLDPAPAERRAQPDARGDRPGRARSRTGSAIPTRRCRASW